MLKRPSRGFSASIRELLKVQDAVVYRFGGFELEPARHRLMRNAREVQLPPRALSVLEVLVARAPETVDKQELLDRAWDDVAVVEDNLVQAIRAIRTALEDDPRQPRFVQTVHRRGYRFVAAVERGDAAGSGADDSPGRQQRHARRSLVTAAALATVLVLTGAALLVKSLGCAAPVTTLRSLAVLPMAEISEGVGDTYFADGMTDALITELARNPELEVISRTSTISYRETTSTVPEICRELGVDAVVEGTVTRVGGRVRIIAQLVDSRDRHRWGESFERPMEDVLRLQRSVAEAIAREVGLRLDGTGGRTAVPQPRVSPEAHEAYLRGRHSMENRTQESLLRAVVLFQDAIDREPAWAAAWLGLADATNLLANYGFQPSTEARPRARMAALEALRLDPDLAAAHTALALVEAEFDWDFSAAEQSFRRSLTLNPSNANTHSWYAHFLVAQGRLDDALSSMRRAHRLDPLSSIFEANIGWFLLYRGDHLGAERSLRDSLGFDPDFSVAHYYLGIVLAAQQRYDEALQELEKAIELSGQADYAIAALAFVAADAGQLERARAIHQRLLTDRQDRYVSPVSLTLTSLALDDRDAAFAWLEQACAERKGWLLHMRVDPFLSELRDDPSFDDLVHRIGLPQPPRP